MLKIILNQINTNSNWNINIIINAFGFWIIVNKI